MWTFIYGGSYNYWFWGLRSSDGFSFNTERIDILITGLIIGLIILICGIKLVLSANSVRSGKFSFEDQKMIWIVIPSLTIMVAIMWFFYISNFGDGYFVPSGFKVWDYFFIGFGLIGTFSGGTLAMLGYFFFRIIRDTNIMSSFVTDFETKPKKEIIVPHKKFPTPEIQKASPSELPNFCPMCGFKAGEEFKFCPNCGFKF